MAKSVIGNTDGLGVDASGLLYNTPYPENDQWH